FGAVIVPPHDLPRADREFYLVQSETYLSEHNGAEVNTAKIANETPDLTMFVGTQFDTVFKEGAYTLKRGNPEGGGCQALDLASAQGGFVEMVFEEPGRYT
ncbi:hypothetical protein BXA17_20105, partial [Acinetobacter baumannii]|uniref:hypothetical protein n=1 Tax=Acinetobacter baumannii TaxID=470 RepID=UPI000B6F7304